MTFHGKASHAGNAPYKGANANIAAMRFALAAAGLADVDKGTTVNPGVIEGGSAPNVISENALLSSTLATGTTKTTNISTTASTNWLLPFGLPA